MPEATNIYRGEKFFKTFLNIDYKELDKYFSQISESKEIRESFDLLYNKVVNYEKE